MLGVILLIAPLHFAFELDPALADRDLDLVLGHAHVGLEGLDDRRGDVFIAAPADAGQDDLDLVGDGLDAPDALRRPLGHESLPVRVHVAAQGDDAVLDRDPDVGCVDAGLPLELVQDVSLQFRVGLHVSPPRLTSIEPLRMLDRMVSLTECRRQAPQPSSATGMPDRASPGDAARAAGKNAGFPGDFRAAEGYRVPGSGVELVAGRGQSVAMAWPG